MNISNLKVTDVPGKYQITGSLDADEIIALAIKLARNKLKKGTMFNSPSAVTDYLQAIYATEEKEVFAMIHLDSQHRVIELETLFTGTIASASVYPREIIKSVMNKNSCKLILCHNHPSGLAEPSSSDKAITTKIINALNFIDVEVLDHIIVGTESTVSFAERGLI